MVVALLHDRPLYQFIDKVRRVSTTDRHTIARQILIKELKLKIASSHRRRANNKPVLIFSRKYDPEVDLVCIYLLTKGIDHVRFNFEDVPTQAMIRHFIKQKSDLTQFILEGKSLDISNVSVAWLRHFDLTEMNFYGHKEPFNTFLFQQWHDAIQILQRNLSCRWINSPQSVAQADDKGKQLAAAKAVGFDIPSTLITNDPKAALDFCNLHRCNLIIKALHHHSVELGGKIYSVHTRTVKRKDIRRLAALIHIPCILQEKISKKSELRISVVGDRVFPAKVSFLPNQKDEDIHRYRAADLKIEADKSFSQSNAERCRKLVKSLGLKYAALDFVVDKKNHPVFLEMNPAGDWLWIEEKTRQPITKAVVSLITRYALK
jgi:glutathione synthase/RimK-type ligase-like ATP-grasp enzyme